MQQSCLLEENLIFDRMKVFTCHMHLKENNLYALDITYHQLSVSSSTNTPIFRNYHIYKVEFRKYHCSQKLEVVQRCHLNDTIIFYLEDFYEGRLSHPTPSLFPPLPNPSLRPTSLTENWLEQIAEVITRQSRRTCLMQMLCTI